MSKFKIGDRVKIIDTTGDGGAHGRMGHAGVVTHVQSDSLTEVIMDSDGATVSMFARRFELLPAVTLETGTLYRTRSGKVTGRVTQGDTGFEAIVDGRVRIYDGAGGHVHGSAELDIVGVWVPKVGERVRIKSAKLTHKRGHVGEEVTIDRQTYEVGGKATWSVAGGGGYFVWLAEELEPLPVAAPQPATLKLEVGHYYKTRDGRKVGPMDLVPWGGFVDRSRKLTHQRWCENGSFIKGQISNLDLIAEWQETTNIGAQVDTLAEEYGPAPTVAVASNDNAPGRKLVKTGQGYGYELARFGDYVWVDVGKTAPITLRAEKIAA